MEIVEIAVICVVNIMKSCNLNYDVIHRALHCFSDCYAHRYGVYAQQLTPTNDCLT